MHVDGFTTFLMTVFLSMGGSWYLQNNLIKDLVELSTKVSTQAADIKQLREDSKEQNKRITDQDKRITDQNKFITELKLQITLLQYASEKIIAVISSIASCTYVYYYMIAYSL